MSFLTRCRPRKVEAPLPKGTAVRVCPATGCPPMHNTAEDLVLQLNLDPAFAAASVDWSSGSLAAMPPQAAADPVGSPSRVFVIPASSLPAASSIVVEALMTLGGVSAAASLAVPLNRRPACGLAGGACLELLLLGDTFPTEAVGASAVGFSDAEDSQLT